VNSRLFATWLPIAAGLLAMSSVAAQEAVIAFGSCNEHGSEQEIWDHVIAEEPDLWVWLGDNIYADTTNMDRMAAKYEVQLANPRYRRLLAACPVIGTWDDHDYGANDAGNTYEKREESQQLFLDFFDVPDDSDRRTRKGVYSVHDYDFGVPVRIILLDTRYHRDPIGSNGTVLGETQWAWLREQLASSTAELNIIGSSIQVIPVDHPYEKWANFPGERKRLFGLIGETGAKNVVFFSGDRHLAEISRMESDAVPYALYDITSSGMTHYYRGYSGEPNRYRVGEVWAGLNFGVLRIRHGGGRREVAVEIRDKDGNAVRTVSLDFTKHDNDEE